jgi:hypothetical protein
MKNAENLPIKVKFSDGTLGTAFPTDANINNNLPYYITLLAKKQTHIPTFSG